MFMFSLGFADAALAKLDTVGEDNSEYGRALFYKSVILEALGKSDDAENLYKEDIISEVSKTRGIGAESLRNDDFKNVSEAKTKFEEIKEKIFAADAAIAGLVDPITINTSLETYLVSRTNDTITTLHDEVIPISEIIELNIIKKDFF